MTSMMEKAARAVAGQLGDYDSMLVNKREWIAMRGTNHAGDPVDVNGPYRDDCYDMARAVLLAVRGDFSAMPDAQKLIDQMLDGPEQDS